MNTTGATTRGSKNNAGVSIGQAFNSGTHTLLTSASLEINRNALGTGDFTLNLHAATGTPNQFFETGSSLAAATFTNAILSNTPYTFYEFLNLDWNLSPNTVYMIGIAPETTATVKWSLNSSATKDTQTGFISGYSGYNSQEGGNVDSGLHGATIIAVPEPSTHLAVGLALVACGCSRGNETPDAKTLRSPAERCRVWPVVLRFFAGEPALGEAHPSHAYGATVGSAATRLWIKCRIAECDARRPWKTSAFPPGDRVGWLYPEGGRSPASGMPGRSQLLGPEKGCIPC